MNERSGPLTWGQYLPWVTQNAAPDKNTYFMILTFDVIAPPEATVETALGLLDDIVERYEGLRTTFEPADGATRQVVHPMRADGYPRSVSQAHPADGEPPAETTAWLTAPFDLTGAWPLRVAAWRRADGRWVLRLAVHRMILDREGSIVIRGCFHRGFRTGSIIDGTEPPAWNPIDIAAFEQSPAGSRRDERAFDYWRRAMITAPETLFTTARPGRPDDSRFTIFLGREDLRPIVRDLAAAFRVTEPAILTATALAILSWVGGWPRVCATIASNNRSHRDLRRSVSPMLDRSLINVVADPAQTFSAWAGLVAAATIGAYQHSHADPNTLLRAAAEVGLERGVQLERLPILNIFGVGAAATRRPDVVLPANIPPVPEDEYRAKLLPGPLDGVYLRAQILWRRVTVELIGGEQIFDFATAERVVALFPAVLAALAAQGDLPLGKLAEAVAEVGPPGPADTVVTVDHTRVDLAGVSTLLGEVAGVADCAVFARAGRLHAFLVGDDRLTDLRRLRLAVLGRLPEHRQVLAPHLFTVVAAAPAQRDDHAAWSAATTLAEGSGSTDEPLLPQSDAEIALAAAIAAAHPALAADRIDLALPYSLAGGRFERVAELLVELRARGIEGITVDDLVGTQPLLNLIRTP
ncbi:hypothetical protein F4553_007540 [Allocatelliglobosispora scoriae]|uniref:Condensation domain-containing protein n=1 Tax=Allocatelliglobosispora scoriae TaxID=643052 RepID=A0A841C2I7_9ACTN|nr:condensation domain-containing protein [Allocatelliglobosispora scoriae]MBB5874106.1 hypothetical protein [Allocatelliglobosispora scoriae]